MDTKERLIPCVFLVALIISITRACNQDVDCNYNGVCTRSACQCDSGWTGSDCSQMKFKPLAPGTGAYGYSPNVSAWGGNPVLVGKTYHLLVTEMVNHCGLCQWGRNSHIVHATSNNLLGPYAYQNEALPVWSHNPQIIMDNSTGTTMYLLFHIGAADGGKPAVCNKTSPSSAHLSSPFYAPTASSVLHTAPSPAGPWTPQNPEGLGECNNPAPYLFPNGSILVICSQGGVDSYFTETNWKGPWQGRVIKYTGNPGVGTWEDPFIWRDKRGVFKMINHVYPNQGAAPHYWSRVSGFAYSFDGYTWVRQPFQPFTNEVTLTSGTAAFSARERPKIFFDPSDNTTPLALFSGVAEGVNWGCWQCKVDCGIDWTFNIAVAFDL